MQKKYSENNNINTSHFNKYKDLQNQIRNEKQQNNANIANYYVQDNSNLYYQKKQ